MDISLKPEQEQFVQTQIAKGRFANPDEVVGRALKLLEVWEQEYEQWVEETRQKVEVGLAQIERGEVLDGEVVVARLQEKLRKAREAQG